MCEFSALFVNLSDHSVAESSVVPVGGYSGAVSLANPGGEASSSPHSRGSLAAHFQRDCIVCILKRAASTQLKVGSVVSRVTWVLSHFIEAVE